LKKHKRLLKYTVKAGGVILIIMGIMTYTGWMNGVSGYLNTFGSTAVSESNEQQEAEVENPGSTESSSNETPGQDTTEAQTIPAFDFTLVDQYGNTHKLSDYKGKVVFLNFWATWCPPCNLEMPDIEELYKEHNYNKDDIVILGVASPKGPENTNTREIDKDGVLAFLDQKGYTFPILFDDTGEINRTYNITALPTTFMIDKDGNIYGYVPGMLTKDMMRSIIEQTIESTK
jgi:cytochrome c-type biogenesis protein